MLAEPQHIRVERKSALAEVGSADPSVDLCSKTARECLGEALHHLRQPRGMRADDVEQVALSTARTVSTDDSRGQSPGTTVDGWAARPLCLRRPRECLGEARDHLRQPRGVRADEVEAGDARAGRRRRIARRAPPAIRARRP